MALVTAIVETAFTPPIPFDVVGEPSELFGTGASAPSSGGGGGASWWKRLFRVSVTAPGIGTRSVGELQPGHWALGALLVAAVLIGLVVFAGVGVVSVVKRRR